MSRTTRNKRPKMRLGKYLKHKQYKDGLVRDGTPTHSSPRCVHGGDCDRCIGDRTFSSRHRMIDYDEEDKLYNDWQLGEYDNGENGCPNCHRSRLCICTNGLHRCEKCNWCPELNDYAPVDL